MRRMDRYNDEYSATEKRSNKNAELYQDVSNNTKYAHITDVTNSNAYEIGNSSSGRSREAYHKMKLYQTVEPLPREKKELDDFNYLYKDSNKKVYDINSVLEEARRNRKEQDELEEKRKLKNTSYNILAGLNLEELEKYREEKKKKNIENVDEDLIDTIVSKTLAGEIDKATSVDLLSDLMATSAMDKVENPDEIDAKEELKRLKEEFNIKDEEIEEKEENDVPEFIKDNIEDEENEQTASKVVLDKEKIEELKKKADEKTENTDNIDKDFYTRSMDLSEEDFEMSDEFKEKSLPFIVKLLIFILIVALTGVAVYFIYQKMF